MARDFLPISGVEKALAGSRFAGRRGDSAAEKVSADEGQRRARANRARAVCALELGTTAAAQEEEPAVRGAQVRDQLAHRLGKLAVAGWLRHRLCVPKGG
jgi:hypothetical protein